MAENEEEIVDSPAQWVAEHIRKYVESGNPSGQTFMGRHLLLLTTRGRKSGKLRRTALFYGRDSDRYVLVASNGGSQHHPQWYLNLLEEPRVRVQVGPDVFVALARPATEEEKPSLWQMMVKLLPQYEGYQKKARRTIPVVILEQSPDADSAA